MKLNLNKPFKDFNGKDSSDLMSLVMAKILWDSNNVEDPIKYHKWSLLLHDSKPIEIEDKDKKELIESVKKTIFGVGIKAQLIEAINGNTEEQKETSG